MNTADDEAFPAHPDGITAEWLTEALAPRYPGVRVAAVELLETHEVTNSHARLRIDYADPGTGDAPTLVFCKVPPSDPSRRQTTSIVGMGQREVRFYAGLADQVSMRVPEVYVARYSERDGSFLLLMEDLAESGCRVSDGTWGIAPDAAARALEDLADLHVHFEDPARRAAEAPWVQRPQHGSTYGTTMLQYALDHHRDRISDDFATISSLYINEGAALHALWHDHVLLTVVHGDPHIGNLFDDHGRTGFLDWGIINVTTPMRDVSYFLTMAMSIEDRRTHERELLRHYLAVRAAKGGAAITFDEAWRAHRLQAAYTVPASCQIVTFPEGISERRRIFSEAFLARAEAAVADLDAVDALAAEGLAPVRHA